MSPHLRFRLNPDIDWQDPQVAALWREQGAVIGRFLSADLPITLMALWELSRAYVTQHPHLDPAAASLTTILHNLLLLSEGGIVSVHSRRFGGKEKGFR